MWDTVGAAVRHAGLCELELVVVHNGMLRGLEARFREAFDANRRVSGRLIENISIDDPRNAGLQAARHDHVLILEDDVQPANVALFQAHASIHSSYPSPSLAVLGDIERPGGFRETEFALGRFLLPSGSEHPPIAFTFLPFQYFSGANISLKKSMVGDWSTDGFRAELQGSVGALELAYRIDRKRLSKLQIFYDPGALAQRSRGLSCIELMREQVIAGRQLGRVLELHPKAAEEFGLDALLKSCLERRSGGSNCTAIFEGMKAWVRLRQIRKQKLSPGCFLAILEACTLQGMAGAYARNRVPAEAGAFIVERLQTRLRRLSYDTIGSHGH